MYTARDDKKNWWVVKYTSCPAKSQRESSTCFRTFFFWRAAKTLVKLCTFFLGLFGGERKKEREGGREREGEGWGWRVAEMERGMEGGEEEGEGEGMEDGGWRKGYKKKDRRKDEGTKGGREERGKMNIVRVGFLSLFLERKIKSVNINSVRA
jgi:hypothetical protein